MHDSDSDKQIGDDAPTPPEVINPVDVRLAAMNFLARREHSALELQQKLLRRFQDKSLVLEQLQCLVRDNLQSDERYAQSYVRQRSIRGYGPLRIQQEMHNKGLSEQDICMAFDKEAPDWCALATKVWHKKFGEKAAVDLKQQSRRVRFMQYRGFRAENYQHLFPN